ncbi:MAG: serine/threonine-protein kinase, partial [Thermoanaerobaculia bacterium]|nr:serine/threonine-protein kinase [Thermoanaerobaculia bacterium]
MTLDPGTTLGPYEIVGLVGEGGMGEVYRARDPRIDREVAIKVLPSSFAEHPDRLKRFEQEARAAGSLNHPNLLTIYELGRKEESPYIVSELLEGESLRELLRELPPPRSGDGKAKAPLPFRKIVDYGSQIASGLAAAHEKGIVHRDLKPENVFITNDGRVKILDFGLAKLTTTAEEGITNAPTAEHHTDPGTILGTMG